MLPATHSESQEQAGKVALLSNVGAVTAYSVGAAASLLLFSFLCVPSELLAQYLRAAYSVESLSKAGTISESLGFPAVFNSIYSWSPAALVLLAVSAFVYLAVCARSAQIAKKYSSCRSSQMLMLGLAVISFIPMTFLIEFGTFSAYYFTVDFFEGLQRAAGLAGRSALAGFETMTFSGFLVAELGLLFSLILMSKLTLFPEPFLRLLPSGLAIGGGFWKFFLGEKLVKWENIQSIAITGNSAKGKFLRLFLKDGNRYSFSLTALQKTISLPDLMNEIKTFAPAALAPDLLAMIDEGKNEYTELWLKYFSSSGSRQRSGALKSGEILNDGRYEIAGELGQGGQGTAYLAALANPQAEEDKGTTIVLKEYILPVHRGEAIFQQSLKKLQQEADILSKIQHPNIVELKETFVEDHRGYLVMEYIEGEGLKSMVQAQGPQKEQLVIDIAIQVCNALEHLHNMDPIVIHRDLTPDNLILQNDGRVKLVDFNVAHQLESSATATVVGKHAYIPAEQFRGKPTVQSDIFALGGTMHYLLTAKEPEPLSVSHPQSVLESVSKELDAIVAKATAIDQKDRYENAFELRAALYDLARARGYILNSTVTVEADLVK